MLDLVFDDQGLNWSRSNKVNSPAHEVGGIHHGTRWNHGMVEGTIVELNDGRLWMVARTAQDQHYETFSDDYGTTWSEAKPVEVFTAPSPCRLFIVSTMGACCSSGQTRPAARGRTADQEGRRRCVHQSRCPACCDL